MPKKSKLTRITTGSETDFSLELVGSLVRSSISVDIVDGSFYQRRQKVSSFNDDIDINTTVKLTRHDVLLAGRTRVVTSLSFLAFVCVRFPSLVELLRSLV